MNTLLVNTVMGMVENLEDILPKEFAKVEEWKSSGVLAHLLLKENAGGAILIFNETDENKVRELVAQLPLFPHFTEVTYTLLDKQF